MTQSNPIQSDTLHHENNFYIARDLQSLKNFRTPRKEFLGPPLLSKRDGVDKLLKITRYTTKIILSTTASKPSNPTSASAAKPSASANSSKTSTHSAPQTSTPYTASFSPSLHTAVGAWAELIGYVGSIGLKVRDLKGILEDEMCLVKRVENGDEELEKLMEKKLLKKLGLVQDVADGLMAVADVRGGKGRLSGPVLLASAGLLSAVKVLVRIGCLANY
ncbi:hypothetical protein HanXRQr2_Chr16g0736141 [Helianthus annuus]|uniref:Uncharacterized protein n=1 Tax=Helianthus annuus TaxID=4232 RepID=A0A251S240_HELAN|nr:hypothetical protein HanXRQr2_Chr16g0736141 [Helianthus annuus]KAJ0459602.1 hypothetical protein HanHA89_Chr16g0650801 [Helianthus annuus]